MNRTKLLSVFVLILISISAFSQESHTLVTIDDKNYSVEEFDFIYNKNNSYTEEPKSKKEYIDLFVNYKLKVHEAMAQGFDTLPSFTKEFNYYKDELAKPYLSDKSVTEHLKKEAYERIKNEVNASHILIRTNDGATPEDTLKSYNKAKMILDRIKKGEDFAELAFEFSEDPSAKKNKGNLGYFSGFMMVYPFESAAFNTEVGQVSEITRSSFGYHIIKVHDKREARGELRTAHIMMMFPPNSSDDVVNSKKAKIDSIYQLVLKGDDFGTLAQNFSEDRNSARNNGELPWFGTGRMIPEYSEPAFELDSIKPISEVIRTPYGFHIIKLLEKRGVKSYDEMEEEITNRISKDERAYQGKKAVVTRLKKEYGFALNDELQSKVVNKAKESNVSDDAFYAFLEENDGKLFGIKTNEVKVAEFTSYLKGNRQFTKAKKAQMIDELFEKFMDDKIIEFEKTQLTQKYPEYRFLLNEYHDGLLIFEVSQKEIWNKASEDSIGIVKYYEANKLKYFYPEKLKGKIVFAKDKKVLKTVKATLTADSEMTNDSLKQIIGKDNIKCIDGEFERGEFSAVDKQIWKDKKSKGKVDEAYPYVYALGDVVDKKYKELDETKGQVIADYQTEIETKWIEGLKAKYKTTVNTKALKYSKKTSKKK